MTDIIVREELFSNVLNFNKLKHVKGSLYNPITNTSFDSTYASNSIGSGRVSLTSLAFGITTELFCLSQISKYVKPEEFILDLGCGEPALFSLMNNSMIFRNYVGIDVRSSPLISFGNPGNCVVICDSAINSDILKKEAFKVVIMSEVLEHLDKELGINLLKSAYTYLSPEGKLVLTTPIKPKGVDIDMEHEKEKWDHIVYYEVDSLVSTLKSCGFIEVSVSYGKFIGRSTTYKTIRKALDIKYGQAGTDIFDTLSNIFTPRIASSFLSTYAGDYCGHVQITATKS